MVATAVKAGGKVTEPLQGRFRIERLLLCGLSVMPVAKAYLALGSKVQVCSGRVMNSRKNKLC